MKSMSRLAALFALVVVALFPATSVAVKAQAVACNGLPDADCALLQGATGADGMAKLMSFTADYSLAASIAGTDSDDGNVNVTGTGSFSMDPAVMAALQSGADLSTVLKGTNPLSLDTTFKASGSMVGNGDETFEIRAVNGTLYFMGDPTTQKQWLAFNLPAAVAFAQGYVSSSLQGAIQGILQTQDTPPNVVANPKVQADFAALMKVPGVFKDTASDGPMVDGQATRKITASLDVATVVNAPELKTLITDVITASGQPIDPAAVISSMDPGIIVQLLKNSSLQQIWLVGTTDKLLHGIELSLAIKIDPTYIASVTNNPDAREFDTNFDLNIQLSKIGQPITVQPVPDAQQNDILGILSGTPAVPTPAH